MKRISKGIACALVLGVATLGLTGCGTKATTDDTNTNGSAPQQTQQPQQTDKPDTAQQPKEDTTTKQPVEAADGAGDPILTQELATYITHAESLESEDSVKITKLEVVEETKDSKIVKATIDVKTNGNAKSSFKQGANERYVQFNNVQDVWEVAKMSESPLKLAK